MSPYEIAYRIPGQAFRRKTFKTEAALQKFVEALLARAGADVEIRYAA